ncbi:hypothetical protein [uncultured Tateyamaria sp.]|uniref:hypothetical protein n=1 Tax=uncultured Tateyamaria sp. TaxID=455651 RepID=UPI002618BEB6|nr:hypothetical protein [uncultured Tateyamaria sp.]
MGALTLLALLTGGLFLTVLEDSDSNRSAGSGDPETPTDGPETPTELDPDPVDPSPEPTPFDPASQAEVVFDEANETLSITVDEESTGELHVIRSEVTEGNNTGRTFFSAKVYLVPEGTTFPPTDEEMRQIFEDERARLTEDDDPDAFTLSGDAFLSDSYFEVLSEYQIAELDLGVQSFDQSLDDNPDRPETDTRPLDTVIEANREITIHTTDQDNSDFIRSPTERGSGLTFLSPFGIEASRISASSDSGQLTQETILRDGTFVATDADEQFQIELSDWNRPPYEADLTIDAGGGNDTLSFGEDAPGTLTLQGGAGDDLLDLDAGFSGTAFGGTGNDVILAQDGLLTDGAVIDAGAGDDQIVIANALDFTITTGDGADLVALGPELRDSLLPITITDFDPAEDALVLALGVENPDEVELTIVRNLAEDRTEIRATVPAVEAMTVTEFGVLLYLDGAPDISESDVAIVNELPAPTAVA